MKQVYELWASSLEKPSSEYAQWAYLGSQSRGDTYLRGRISQSDDAAQHQKALDRILSLNTKKI